MKKRLIISLLIIIVAIISIYKYNVIHKYTISKDDKEKIQNISNGLMITDLKVITKQELENDLYLQYKNLFIKNIFDDFHCAEEEKAYQCIKEDNTFFSMKEVSSFIQKFENLKDGTKIIKSNKIQTDIDLFGFVKEASISKNTFLKPIRDIKRDYLLQKYAIDSIPLIHSLDLVAGDYSGYILHTSFDSRELYLTYNNHTYLFYFHDLDYFDDELIQDLMNTIKIV